MSSSLPSTDLMPLPRRSGKHTVLRWGVALAILGIAIGAVAWVACPWILSLQQTSQDMAKLEARVAALESHAATTPALPGNIPATTDVTAAPAVPAPETGATDHAVLAVTVNELRNRLETTERASRQAHDEARAAQVVALAYADALAHLRTAVQSNPALADPLTALAPYAETGAPTTEALHESLVAQETTARAAYDKAHAEHWWERLLITVKNLISVHPLHGLGADADVTPIESALNKGDAAAARETFTALPPDMQQALAAWRNQLEARYTIDDALRTLAARLTDPAAP